MEARDGADEVYQTYHHGRCIAQDWTVEQLTEPGNALMPINNGSCAGLSGYRSIQLSRGKVIPERRYNHGPNPSNEFFTRDHVFAVEWTDRELRYFINNVLTHTVVVGSVPDHTYLLAGPALPGGGVPAAWKQYAAHNFPPNPMYWILNHSLYVPPAGQPGFVPQELRFDYVKTLAQCQVLSDFCPCGGAFAEGVGCTLAPGMRLTCPPGQPAPTLTGSTYPSRCDKARMECVAGGEPYGPNCRVHVFEAGVLTAGVNYWVDADPRWPGVFYPGVAGGCPHGGTGGNPNCQLHSFAPDVLEDGVIYWVDTDPRWPGVFYEPDFRQ
jgi:hypothetical protein